MQIPAGSFVVPVITYANFDETRWPEPEEFRLDRPNGRKHFSFGLGRISARARTWPGSKSRSR